MSSQPRDSDRSRRKQHHQPNGSGDDTQSQSDQVAETRTRRTQKKKKGPKQLHESALSSQLQSNVNGFSTQQGGLSSGNRPEDSSDQHSHKPGRKKNMPAGTVSGGSPGPKKQKPPHTGSTTPHKPAVEAYAGPTFHASPAPSSLPIPKFFSKSAPSADQDVGLTARLQKEETMSSGSEEGHPSPSRQPLQKVASATAAQGQDHPALFDMLINADRQEKARQRQSQQYDGSGPPDRNGSYQHKHSRTLTAGSMFPIDMDGTSGRGSPTSANFQANKSLPRQSSAHTDQTRPYPSNDEANLKRMLFSSPPPQSGANTAHHPYQGPRQSSPAYASSPGSPGNASPYGTPSPASSVNGLAATSRPVPGSPYAQSSPSPAARRFPAQQSNSSLRREVSPGELNLANPPPANYMQGYPGINMLSSQSPLTSPTNPRFPVPNGHLGTQSPYGSHGQPSPARHESPVSHDSDSAPRFSPQDALRASLGKDASSKNFNVTGMENELRKILRIDELRATSTTAPQN